MQRPTAIGPATQAIGFALRVANKIAATLGITRAVTDIEESGTDKVERVDRFAPGQE